MSRASVWVLLARLPKARVAGGEVESEELRAFAFKGPISAIAKAVIELSDDHDRDGPGDIGEEIEILLLNPRPGFSRALAAKSNGESREDSSRAIAVGVGALGSQVVVNLARGGFGQWTLVDDDLLQPHNLARHALGGWGLGVPKAIALADTLNRMVEGPPMAEAAVTNVLKNQTPGNQVVVDWRSASVILDMSASIAVARYLRHEIRFARPPDIVVPQSLRCLTDIACRGQSERYSPRRPRDATLPSPGLGRRSSRPSLIFFNYAFRRGLQGCVRSDTPGLGRSIRGHRKPGS